MSRTTLTSTAKLPGESLGDFERHGDVGAPAVAGAASYDPARQEYTLTAAGGSGPQGLDRFHFAWNLAAGDFILRARVRSVSAGPVRLGWIARTGLETDAAYVAGMVGEQGVASLQVRRARGAAAEQTKLPVTNADVLQLERRGNQFRFSAAQSGEPFVAGEWMNCELEGDLLAGLFVGSSAEGARATAVFSDVRWVRPAKPDFRPYRDFIGSVLEILDVHTGRLEKIYESSEPFEAPNWTTDGQALIYNVSGRAEGWGRLVRFDLATGARVTLDTGLAINNNNDHVLSMDGAMLAISDQSPSHGGKSRVFTLPATGGTPTAITPRTPSYLHGWSPDQRWLVFTGVRDNKYDIFKIPAAGGEEIRLTDAPGVNDGPEFTPAGEYIYFNSSRTGRMQIWRMRPDGSGQEQITNDGLNDWFPHLSPDGQWIAFVSFGLDVAAGDHPYYRHVYVRLMPAAGGKPRVLAYVYGGQGTMNVPSWSPDSRRIAFVSNTGLV